MAITITSCGKKRTCTELILSGLYYIITFLVGIGGLAGVGELSWELRHFVKCKYKRNFMFNSMPATPFRHLQQGRVHQTILWRWWLRPLQDMVGHWLVWISNSFPDTDNYQGRLQVVPKPVYIILNECCHCKCAGILAPCALMHLYTITDVGCWTARW